MIVHTPIRRAVGSDTGAIGSIWSSGWREAHLGHVPDALVRARTAETFVTRARENISHTLVATKGKAVIGFVAISGDEVEQLYVDAGARSEGVADALLAAAEGVVADAGYAAAWLAVVAGNARARRLYERCGWVDEGGFVYSTSTQDGTVDVPSRRYTKPLAGGWHRIESPDGLLLRAVDLGDADGVFAVHRDPRVYRLDPLEVHLDVEQSRRFMQPLEEHWARHGFGYWAVLVPTPWWPDGPAGAADRDGDRVHAGVGGIQHHVVLGQSVLNVYFRLAPVVQGRRIAGRIVEASLRMAARVAPDLDIVVRTRPANTAARRVAIRTGFVDEGLEPGVDDMQLLRRSSHNN